MGTNEIITTLKKEKAFLQQQYGVERIALFGSQARGGATPDSDIDFYVELEKADYSLLMGLYTFLENKLGAKIDIVRKGPHLSKRFLDHIQNELIDV